MAVNRTVARIILQELYNGFYFDEEDDRYQIKLLHVTENNFRNMQHNASRHGIKLRTQDVNSFLGSTRSDNVLFENIYTPLLFSLIMYGEVFRLNIKIDKETFSVLLMKMSDEELLILDASEGFPANSHYITLEVSANILSGSEIYIPSIGKAKILNVEIARPRQYHYYLDPFFMRDLYKHELTDNLWNCYYKTKSFLKSVYHNESNDYGKESLKNLFESFEKNGLSTYVLRMMINGIRYHERLERNTD